MFFDLVPDDSKWLETCAGEFRALIVTESWRRDAKTKKLFLSGEIINAEKAKKIGLVDDIITKEKIDKKVEKIANNLCENVSSNSILQTKTILNEIKYIDLAKSKQLAVKLNASSRKTNSFKKGINAFLNKKSINW